jgi:hypothetical protein
MVVYARAPATAQLSESTAVGIRRMREKEVGNSLETG